MHNSMSLDHLNLNLKQKTYQGLKVGHSLAQFDQPLRTQYVYCDGKLQFLVEFYRGCAMKDYVNASSQHCPVRGTDRQFWLRYVAFYWQDFLQIRRSVPSYYVEKL